jgi:phage/plasmid primase-like uncharacterized protein
MSKEFFVLTHCLKRHRASASHRCCKSKRTWRQRKYSLICAGYATGVTLHEITGGYPIAVVFSRNNLFPVAQTLRRKYSNLQVANGAHDNGLRTNNPDITKICEAAAAIDALGRIPNFSGFQLCPDDADFNDLTRLVYQSIGI